jgi:hypothetical protein
MTAVDMRISQVAIFGRVADELTRADLNPRRYTASLLNHRRQAVQKEDGYFVFADLPSSPPDYEVELEGRHFQRRRLTVTATGVSAVEIDTDGEDELQVIITDIDTNRVSFATVPFVPRITEDAAVLGEGGFSTTLAETLEGVDVEGAELQSATGITVGEALRIVRSTRLLLRPGPYYPFPEGTTVVALRVVDSLPGSLPIAEAQIEITAVNGATVSTMLVDGVTLFRADLPPTPTTPFMIGTLQALGTFTNARGDAVFYYTPTTPVTSLTLSVTKAGYVTQTPTVVVTLGARTSSVVQLVRS